MLNEMSKKTTSANATMALSWSSSSSSLSLSKEKDREGDCEKRPGGMLVQKRIDGVVDPPICIRVRVAYGAARFDISINSQATFGELKKLLTSQCGLHHMEQKITYKGKVKQDKQFLDICGVKDKSKLILTEYPGSKEKRFLEMHKNDKLQRARSAISEVASEIDSLEEQVTGIEQSIRKGVKVADVRIPTLIELLMRQAVTLDNIFVGVEISTEKNLQGKRVQKCVESLDMLKISNAGLKPLVGAPKSETFNTSSTTTPYWNLLD